VKPGIVTKTILMAWGYGLLLFIPYLSGAQYISRLGRFQVDQRKGCAPFTVTITNANLVTTNQCTGANPCLMNFTGTNQQQNLFTFTYTTPGTYTLSVLYQNIGSDDIQITVDQNIQPSFEMYSCANRGVAVRVFDSNYDQYVFDFNNDGVAESIQPFSNNISAQFAYASTTPATIAVRGRDVNSADNCTARTQAFTPLTTLPAPNITSLAAPTSSSLKVDFNGQPNIQYRLEISTNNNTNFQLAQTLTNVNTTTINNLRLDDNFHCFRISAYNPCTNANTFSTIVCSQNVDLVVESGLNRLTIATAPTNITQTQIIRTPSPSTNLPGAQSVYQDTDITCNREYCYQVIMVYSTGATSTSLKKCGLSFINTSPPAVDNVSSLVDKGVELRYNLANANNPPKEITVFRSTRGSGFSFFAKADQVTSFVDETYTTDANLCYKINYEDNCGNRSLDGATICPIRLLADRDRQNAVTVRWTRFTGWKQGVAGYVLEKFNDQGALIQSVNMNTDTTYFDNMPDFNNQIVVYRVRATAAQTGVVASVSNTVRIVKEISVSFPTAFSPDRSGPVENETFRLTTQFVQKMSLSVFDRWGALVFTTEKNEPWDGTSGGRAMPPESYIWKAQITDLAGQTTTRAGTLVLIRRK
jgi:gliding motility-associated-like protein